MFSPLPLRIIDQENVNTVNIARAILKLYVWLCSKVILSTLGGCCLAAYNISYRTATCYYRSFLSIKLVGSYMITDIFFIFNDQALWRWRIIGQNIIQVLYFLGKNFVSATTSGDLQHYWCSSFYRGGRYNEGDAKIIVEQILNVVAFCHLQGVVHRDLKPEVCGLNVEYINRIRFILLIHAFW